ncbi:MAG: S41 family peptidase [Thermoflavifilum aggregans]|nr:S41 family peptidase [Thermoflavifilum aggregans]
MKPSKKLQVFLPLILSLVLALGMFLGFKLRDSYKLPHRGVQLFVGHPGTIDQILMLIRNKYVDSVNDSLLRNAAIDAILHHLDPHSVYIPPQDVAEVNEELDAEFGGIGVEYMLWHDSLTVLHVIPGTPAAKAGLQPGDVLLSANDAPLSGHSLTADQIRNLLRGPVGTSLALQVKRFRQVQPFQLTLKRGEIPNSSIDAAVMLNPETGYIRLNVFGSDTYQEWKKAVTRLKQQGMRQLILDLRDNPGGYMDAALRIADECIPGRKLLLYTQGVHYPREDYYSSDNGIFENGKLAVLVNENSASASEILAGILQDWDRAAIIGRQTFGKGLVQEQYTLSNGGAIRLTVARYYLPSGRCIQKPYAQDPDFFAYHNTLSRYPDTDEFSPDSIHFRDTTPYYTRIRKRKVYAESGITPDILVPLDSAAVHPFIAHTRALGLMQYFALQYYLTHPSIQQKFSTWKDFASGFSWQPGDLPGFLSFCRQQGLYPPTRLTSDEQTYLLTRLKAELARIIWGSEGYYAVHASASDHAVEKALAWMQQDGK